MRLMKMTGMLVGVRGGLARGALLLGVAAAVGLGPVVRAQEGRGDDGVGFPAFTDPVDLSVLVDFVSRRLGINILVMDEGLEGQTVVFRAPMEMTDDQLMPLLEMLINTRGYTLTKEPDQGWHLIVKSADLPVIVGEGATTHVYATPLVRPSSLSAAVAGALGNEASGARMTPVDELGILLVTAPPRLNRTVREVIDLIIEESDNKRLHRFDLSHIAAAEARGRLLELMGQGGGAATGAPARGAGGGAAPAAGASGGLGNLSGRLLVDRAGNSLILRGSDGEAEEVRRYVEMVDAPSRLIIRRYQAGAMASTIAGFGEGMGLGSIGGGAAAAGARGAATVANAGSRFVLDAGDESGAFTYYGTESQHSRVEELVDEFSEERRLSELQVKFYKLEHAEAAVVAEVLTALLEEQGEELAESPFLPGSVDRRVDPIQRRDTFGAPADGGGDGGEVTGLTPAEGIAIIADEANNQLIIRAPARNQIEFVRMIQHLDLRRPQVQLEVQLVSVSASNDFSLGFDFSLESGEYPLFTNLGIRGGVDPFTTMFPNPAGITAAIVRSSYIPVIVNAMQTNGDGKIRSVPHLLVNDNETANLSSTRDEPFATTTQVAGAPSQTGLGGTLSAGTTLSVTPRISNGGFITLEITLNLSSFGERPSPDLPPVRLSDDFDSVITIPTDSTVIVGGLVFESDDNSVNRVPLLGDLPLIGRLFQSTSEMHSKRTLYIFITPKVMRDPTFADLRLTTRGYADEAEIEMEGVPSLAPVMMPILGEHREWESRSLGEISSADEDGDDEAS